jgi:hypothetical protein
MAELEKSTTDLLIKAVGEFRVAAKAAREALLAKKQAKTEMVRALRDCGVDPKFLTDDESAEARFVGVNPLG